MDRSYRDLEGRKSRAKDLEKLYTDMSMQKELQVIISPPNTLLFLGMQLDHLWLNSFNGQKKGRKRKLRDDELLNPNGKAVYKWRADRKRWREKLSWLCSLTSFFWSLLKFI